MELCSASAIICVKFVKITSICCLFKSKDVIPSEGDSAFRLTQSHEVLNVCVHESDSDISKSQIGDFSFTVAVIGWNSDLYEIIVYHTDGVSSQSAHGNLAAVTGRTSPTISLEREELPWCLRFNLYLVAWKCTTSIVWFCPNDIQIAIIHLNQWAIHSSRSLCWPLKLNIQIRRKVTISARVAGSHFE